MITFCGDRRSNWSLAREAEFTRLARSHGCEVRSLPAAAEADDLAEQVARLDRWVAELPRPIGVFACYHIRGQQLLDAFRNTGVAVPKRWR